MLRALLAAVGGALFAAAPAQNVVPGILVVQLETKAEIVEAAKKIHGKAGSGQANLTTNFNAFEFETNLKSIPMESIAADQIFEDGRVTPISWAMTDPVFRAAVEERILINPADAPTLADLVEALPKLKAQYIFQVFAFESGPDVWTHAKLFRGDKEVWADEVRVWNVQTQSQFDNENIRVSIARTWVQFLAGGPLKNLPPKPRAATPTAQPGLRPAAAVVEPPPSASQADNKQLLLQAMKLMSEKRYAEAINLLRDSVDAEPNDVERRRSLISALHQIGEPRLAAEEARRAAHLNPDQVELWILAARAWIASGLGAEAIVDLNEAIARDPEGAGTRMLLGELQVEQGRCALAVDHLTAALKSSPTAFAYRLRAFARAAVGDAAGSAADLAEASDATPAETAEESARRHRLIKTHSLKLADDAGSELRIFVQRARMDPKDADLAVSATKLEETLRAVEACFLADIIPAAFQGSSDRLGLALKLLLQSITDLRGSFGTLDEDKLTDATINLGEAFRALKAAREQFQTEIG